MKEEQSRLLRESMEQDEDIWREGKKKMAVLQWVDDDSAIPNESLKRGYYKVADTDILEDEVVLQWVDNEALKLWSKYILFCVKEHGETLLRKRRNLQTTGDYGEVDEAEWWKEIQYFLSKAMLVPEQVMKRIGVQLIRLVNPMLDTLEETAPPRSRDIPIESLNPLQYEEVCAEEMRLLGYEVRTTKATGDQGVDVIARRGNVTVVLQCKLHASPVGNKAVQEVYAGKNFLEADLGAVVTNQEFTESARQLAQALNVLLLHHSQLGAFFGEGSD